MLNNSPKRELETILVYGEPVITNSTKLKNIWNNILTGEYNFSIIWIIVILFGIIIMVIFYTCFN